MRKTVSEWLSQSGAKFDRVIEDGKIYYKDYRISSICSYGKIVDCGIIYNDTMIIANENDIDVIDYGADNPQANEFISDHAKYAQAIGVSTIEDLIGLPIEEYNAKVSERYEREKGLK